MYKEKRSNRSSIHSLGEDVFAKSTLLRPKTHFLSHLEVIQSQDWHKPSLDSQISIYILVFYNNVSVQRS